MNSSQRRQRARAIEAKYGAQADLLIATAKLLDEAVVRLPSMDWVTLSYYVDPRKELIKKLHYEKTRR